MADAQITVVNASRREVYKLEEIYDPDVHGALDATTEGLFIPEVPSLVCDENNQWFQVTYVDPQTHKSTIEPLKILWEDTTELYDPAQQHILFFDDRIEPTKLNVDSRIAIYGNNNKRYRVVRKLDDGTELPLSVYISSTGNVGSDLIPLEDVDQESTIKRCTNCHSLENIVEGEQVVLQVFDATGTQTAALNLVAKKSYIFNDLRSSYNPIVDFDVKCDQMNGDQFVIYENQDPINLGIEPRITYQDGTQEMVAVDGNTCVADGLLDFVPSFPGHTQEICFRYFLTAKQASTILVEEGGSRFVTCTKQVIVEAKRLARSIKLSCIPQWNAGSASWSLRFYAYVGTRDKVVDVTDSVRYIQSFDGTLFGQTQTVKVELNSIVVDPETGDPNDVHQQDYKIKVALFSNPEPFVLQDGSYSITAYGAESSTDHAPVLRYNRSLDKYYISSQLYATVDEFLQTFYYNSAPPYDSANTTVPPVPTHFTFRKAYTSEVIMTLPVEVDEYIQYNSFTSLSAPDEVVDSVVIMEFLLKVGSEYTILFGVPVPVREFEE